MPRFEVDEEKWSLKYKPLYGDEYGLCHYESKTVYISSNKPMTPTVFLDVHIHELLHAHMPWMSEESVDTMATTIAEVLMAGRCCKPSMEAKEKANVAHTESTEPTKGPE